MPSLISGGIAYLQYFQKTEVFTLSTISLKYDWNYVVKRG
jgi:hypothetical protein